MGWRGISHLPSTKKLYKKFFVELLKPLHYNTVSQKHSSGLYQKKKKPGASERHGTWPIRLRFFLCFTRGCTTPSCWKCFHLFAGRCSSVSWETTSPPPFPFFLVWRSYLFLMPFRGVSFLLFMPEGFHTRRVMCWQCKVVMRGTHHTVVCGVTTQSPRLWAE